MANTGSGSSYSPDQRWIDSQNKEVEHLQESTYRLQKQVEAYRETTRDTIKLKEEAIANERKARRDLERLRQIIDQKLKPSRMPQVGREKLQTADEIDYERFAAEQRQKELMITSLQSDLNAVKVKSKALTEELARREAQHAKNTANKSEAELVKARREAELEGKVKEIRDLNQTMKQLQEAHELSQETLTTELEAERTKNNVLQKELFYIKADSATATQQADSILLEFEHKEQHNKDLQQALEEQSVAHERSLGSLTAELKAEETKAKVLQEELASVTADFATATQQGDNLLLEFKSKGQLILDLQLTLEEERAAYELSLEMLTAELRRKETEMDQQKELQTKYGELQAAHEKLAAELELERQRRENTQNLQNDLVATTPDVTPKKPSLFKRFRHALGLRKPQWLKNKKNASQPNNTN